MQTHFAPERLRNDPALAQSEKAIRNCVHCGFCNATCPTYGLLGDELDGPRGRIMLMKDLLENHRVPTAQTVLHLDRCLSCLSCTSTCPSGVDYMHLVDHARAYVHEHYVRPWWDRWLRTLLARWLPYPRRFSLALALGRGLAPLRVLLPARGIFRSLRAMLELAGSATPGARTSSVSETANAARLSVAPRRGRVLFLRGCAEPVLAPQIQQAARRLVARMGYEVIEAPGEGCCGALVHHLGREAESLRFVRANVAAWSRRIEDGGLDAILVTASGCGTSLKDYAFLLRNEPEWAARAAKVSALVRDISEFVAAAGLPARVAVPPLKVAYHAACSLQHGQRVREAPMALLTQAGFQVSTPSQAHLCCGSAGTYNLLQPELATQLREAKLAAIGALQPELIASGNIGCLTQLSMGAGVPVLHTVELLDWATGGPRPEGLACDEDRLKSTGKKPH